MGLAHIGLDFEKANQFFTKALELEKKYYGESSMHVADVYHNIGKNYFIASDYKNAALYFEKAQHIKRNEKDYTHSLIKTEFALANTLVFMLKEPFKKIDIEKIRALYVSVLKGYSILNNIDNFEFNNTLQIISEFLNKIGEESSSLKLKEFLVYDGQECKKGCKYSHITKNQFEEK
ncbi:MAG: tetratricopeptide repeat protein [Lachnospiraceae bacterium]|nr:tetratricopeptide repeat protein [Lachnospiraceae bacterium]